MTLTIRVSLTLSVLLASVVYCGARQQAAGETRPDAPRPSEFLKIPENLVADGIPPVPATLPGKLTPYMNAYGLPLAGWDAVKREVWIKTYHKDGMYFSRVAAPGAKPEQVYKLPPWPYYDLYYKIGERYLVYTADQDGDEKFQLILYDTQTAQTTRLTDGTSRNVEPVWSNGMKRIAFGSTPAGRAGMDLYIIDPFNPSDLRRFATSPGYMLQTSDWSPDDGRILYLEYIANRSNNKLWLYDLASGTTRLLTPKPQDEQTVYDSPRFSRDGRGVYLVTNRRADYRQLAYLDLSTMKYTFLSEPVRWDVEEFALSPDGKTIAFVANEDGIARLYLLDVQSRKITPTRWTAAGLIAPQVSEPALHLHWHPNSVDLAFDFVSPRTPDDVYSLNTRTGEFTRWVQGVSTGLPLDQITEPRTIRWKSFDGRTISGLLYAPPARFKGPRPVVIELHGGPEEQSRPQYDGIDNFYLNELGVAKIYPNVRGSLGYGKTFMALDDGHGREGAVKDVGALLDWIAAQPELDAKRVMVMGGSYGGYLTLSTAAAYGDRIRAAVSRVGPSNLVTYLESTEGWRRDERRQEYGDERDPKVRAFLERISPLRQADKIKAPLLIVQGQNDPRVKMSESVAMRDAVRRHGTLVWYLLGKNEGHGFGEMDNYLYQVYVTILFTQEFLLK